MCLAVPMKIIEIRFPEARVELAGVKRRINLGLMADHDLAPGDYVIVHAGFAIEKLDEADARERLEYFREMVELE